MEDLRCIISNCFRNSPYYNYWRGGISAMDTGKSAYMLIPTSEDSFEVPLFAMGTLRQLNTGTIVADLKEACPNTRYKSLDANMRYGLLKDFVGNRLATLPTKPGEPRYYIAYGAIFNRDYVPVMLLTWKIKRHYFEDGTSYKYQFIKPIIRVNPHVFIYKSNSVERYIINKIIPAALENIEVVRPTGLDTFMDGESIYYKLKAEIEDIPFHLYRPATPSISTTNESLLELAQKYIDEIV